MNEFGFLDNFQEHLKQAEEQHQRQKMENDAVMHQMHEFLASLDQDQMEALGSMLRIATVSKDLTYLYLGMITARLADRYNVCPACLKNHEEQLSEFGNL